MPKPNHAETVRQKVWFALIMCCRYMQLNYKIKVFVICYNYRENIVMKSQLLIQRDFIPIPYFWYVK